MAAPKKYPDEVKARAVRLYRESDPKPTIRKLATQLGVRHEALRLLSALVENRIWHTLCD
ncbi:transposase [Nocardia salmonicida]|uniref:transposase n=1 Tax=Nocardia salmonicida TaxID=53431 RepID=UPI002E2B7325|nr:transposase [Nocardia salmonicida]